MTQIDDFISKTAKLTTDSVIELIQKTHYIIEHEEFKKVTNTVVNLNKELERLRANEKVLVEALTYYAEYEKNTDQDSVYICQETSYVDEGKVAQQALKEVKK